MTAYFIKLLVMLPLVGGMAFAALWLWRKLQPGMAIGQRDRAAKVVEALPLGMAGRLTVVDFADRRLLLAVSRSRIELIAEGPLPAAFALPEAKNNA